MWAGEGGGRLRGVTFQNSRRSTSVTIGTFTCGCDWKGGGGGFERSTPFGSSGRVRGRGRRGGEWSIGSCIMSSRGAGLHFSDGGALDDSFLKC